MSKKTTHPNAPQKPDTLGQFLRHKRQNLNREDFGAPGGLNPRSRGLPVGEAAQLIGVNKWYLGKIEVGSCAPHKKTLARILQTYGATPDEFTYAYSLAEASDTRVTLVDEATSAIQKDNQGLISPDLQALLHERPDIPAYLMDYMWNMLDWNTAADAVFCMRPNMPMLERNVAHILYVDEGFQKMTLNWSFHAEIVLGQLHLDWGQYQHDKSFIELIEYINEQSPYVKKRWARGQVASKPNVIKELEHPHVGKLSLRQRLYTAPDVPSNRLMRYEPADDRTIEKVQYLMRNATQRN